jgi:hypothetical protein
MKTTRERGKEREKEKEKESETKTKIETWREIQREKCKATKRE